MTFQHRGPYVRNQDGTIDCEVRFLEPDPLAPEGWLPYSANPSDPDPRSIGPELFRAIDAKAPKMKAPSKQAVRDMQAALVRTERDRRLAATDWTQLPDVPEDTREAWSGYRQCLRDVTKQPGFPAEVIWPAPPA